MQTQDRISHSAIAHFIANGVGEMAATAANSIWAAGG